METKRKLPIISDREKAEMMVNDAEVMAGGVKFALKVMAKWKKQQIVDWVCDWLNEQSFGGWIDDPVDELIDEFKKAIQNEL